MPAPTADTAGTQRRWAGVRVVVDVELGAEQLAVGDGQLQQEVVVVQEEGQEIALVGVDQEAAMEEGGDPRRVKRKNWGSSILRKD